jgi:hypothetical protein
MQGKNFTMTGSAVQIVAPCGCEGVRLSSPATFSFQWAVRAAEIDPASGVKPGNAVGDALTAEEISSTDFWIEVVAPRGLPFASGEVIGLAVGGSNVVAVRPIRPGNS